ncbi:MAG: Spy/CpxP family protein refolding chaperone [Bacteroidia bacterium]
MASTQHKWQKWSVPLLMGFNVLFLGFMLWQQLVPQKRDFKGPNQGAGIRQFLVKELALNDTQLSEYQALIKEHQSQNKENHQKLRRLMDQQVDMISRASDADEIELIAQEIGNIHADFIRTNAAHFMDLRKILNPDQQTKLEGLLKEVMGKMGRQMGPGGRRPPPPKR